MKRKGGRGRGLKLRALVGPESRIMYPMSETLRARRPKIGLFENSERTQQDGKGTSVTIVLFEKTFL